MNTVTVFLLISCIVGALGSTLTKEQKEKLREHKEACIAETGVSSEIVQNVIKGGAITRSEKLDCFSACLLKKIGIMKEDGAIDIDVVNAKAKTFDKLKPEDVKKVIDECKDLGGKDTCEKGGNILACFITKKNFPVLD